MTKFLLRLYSVPMLFAVFYLFFYWLWGALQ